MNKFLGHGNHNTLCTKQQIASIQVVDMSPKLGGVAKIRFYFAQKGVNFDCFKMIPSLYH